MLTVYSEGKMRCGKGALGKNKMWRLFCFKGGAVQAGLWVEMRETKGGRGQRGEVEVMEELHRGGGL